MASYRAQPPAQPQPAPRKASNDATLTRVGLGSSFLGVVCGVLAYLAYPTGDQSSQKVALAVAVFAVVVLALWIWRLLPQPQPQYDQYAYAGQNDVGPDGLPRPAMPNGGAPAPRPYMPVAPAAPLYSREALQQMPARSSEPNPFINDPLFALEAPAKNVRRFILPKDPDRMCEDGFACDAAHGVYAVTDGVSQSFVSAPWARIIARGFAKQPEAFNDEASFTAWLETRATEWRDWMTNTWMATLNEQRQQRGERPGDWTGDIEDKGAQATLLGLALRRNGKQLEARPRRACTCQWPRRPRSTRGKPYSRCPRARGSQIRLSTIRCSRWKRRQRMCDGSYSPKTPIACARTASPATRRVVSMPSRMASRRASSRRRGRASSRGGLPNNRRRSTMR
ncbi:MAG: hypothetical protein ACRDHE_03180 [Ktedonobacterales bacterium]